MTAKQITFWAVAFKLLWVLTLTQAGSRPWVSTIAVWLYAVLCGSQQERKIWRLVGVAVGCSIVGDTALGGMGVLSNPDGSVLGLSPLWLIGLWAAFATLIPICFTWLYQRLWLAGLLGMLSGTLSYISGGKLGALLVRTDVFDLCCIAIEWGVAFPLLVWMARDESV